MSNPFEKYVQATFRQNEKLDSAKVTLMDTTLQALAPNFDNITKPNTGKSAGDLLVDAAASALKIPTIVGGVAVGAADLALSAAAKPIEGYMRIGNALAPDLIPEPMDVGYGYIAKGLHDTIGYRPEEAKAFIDEKLFSDARKIQEKEYQSGYTAAEDKAFQDSWVNNYQVQIANLQKSGATEQQLKDFNTSFDKQYQEAATQRADKYQTSWDKPLSENIDIIGHGFNNLLENPSLALGGAIESAGYLLPSMAVSRGVLALEKAAKVAKLGAGGVGAIQPLHRLAAAGVGEGSVAGTVSLEQMRSQMPDGIAGGRELLGALGVAASTGLIGAGFGKAASKLGVGDIDSVGLGRAASQVAAMKLPALARPVGAVAQEGAEEFAQTFGESIIPNVTMGKDPLEGLGQELPMGTMAGAIMGAGMNAPSLVTGGFSDISSGLGKVKDAASLKSFDTLSNPEHKNYNPAQAFNIQLKNLESNDEAVRTQAEASVSKIETDLDTARASVEKRIKSIQTTLKAMPPSDQTTDAQKLEIDALGKEYSELTTKSSTLADQYVAFLEAQVTAQEHRDVQQGTQFTEEQAKADIATLTQPIPSQTVWSNQDTDIPVEVIGEPEVDEQGNEFTKVRYTPQEGADPIESYVPTSELVSTQGNNDVAQQEALDRVTRHFSKYSNDDLDLLASSPVLTESQRNSLRVLSKSKRELAAVQDPSQVFDNILNGYKGKTIQESHRGLNQYTDMVNTAVATKNEQLASLALDGLGAFTDDHTAKRDTINEAFGLVQKGTYKEVQVVRTQDGTWGMVPFTAQEVRAGKNADGVVFLEGEALKDAMNKVGGFNVHINSDKNGAITQINNETQLIQDRFNALSGVAESFVGVTPKPVDTSTAPIVDTPIVTEPSDTTPPVVTPVPEAPVQSGAMTPEVNQSLEDYIKSLGRTSTDKYKQDLLTTFNAEVDKSISNGYVGGLVGSTKEYNKEKHAVLVAIALSKGYTVGTPVVGNGVYTATLTKSTAAPATPTEPIETVANSEQQLSSLTKTASDTVKLPSDYGQSDIFKAVPLFKKENPTGIIAFRVNSKRTLLESLKDANAIGNPFNWQNPKIGAGNATKMFDEWLRTGKHTDHAEAPQATEEYRQAILSKLKENPTAKILYYKELNGASHANVLEHIAKGMQQTATPTETKTPVQAEVTTTPSQDTPEYTWGRYPNGKPNLEVSSHGNAFSKQFSALIARLGDGRTIEEAYQLDVKGYRTQGNDWRLGKGKPPINGKSPEELWIAYKDLWKQFFKENPALFAQMKVEAKGKVLTDKFAKSAVSQARAIAELLNEDPSVTTPTPSQDTPEDTEEDEQAPETVEGLVKEHGYLGELLADEDVAKVVKDVIETVLEVKAGEKRLTSYSRFVGLFAVHGYIEYFTKQAKNDPNIIKLTKAANKLRNLVRLTQHINFLEDYVDSQNNDDLKARLNKYPELKSIFSELKVKNPTKGTRSLALDVIADFTRVKNLITTELGKLVQLVGLMYIQAAFEKGQQYLRDTNYADLNEVLSPTVLALLKGENIGVLAKNKVLGDDAVFRRNSLTSTELTFLDKIDGIPVGELSKEDFETVKALVQNAVNAGFNSYKVVNYTRNEEKISSDIVHNIIVEHLPKEGFALENFTPEEVINGAVPESFIWDFEKKTPETTEDEDAVEESARIQFGRLGRVLSNFPYKELHKVPLDKFQAAYKDAHSLAKAAGKASEEAFIAAFKEVEDYLKSVETKNLASQDTPEDTEDTGKDNTEVGFKLTPTGQYTPKDQLKADKATKFIGEGAANSSTAQYAKDAGDKANTGKYTKNDVVFISVNGARANRQAPNLVEIQKAIDAGATILTDKLSDRERSFNVGEREVAAHLTKNGYVEEGNTGVWKPEAKTSDVTEGDKQAPVETKAEPKVKTAEATPPVVSGIKTEGNNTLITSAVSGLTHSVPTKLVNGLFEASYIVKELMEITSKALAPAQRKYLEGLLQVFLALDGTVFVGLYADLSLIQNDNVRETLQKSKGKAVDYLDEGKRIYIDLNNVEPVDLFEILVHEYHHTVTMQGLKKVEEIGKSSPQYARLNAAYKAVKAFIDSNPTVDVRVLRRLEYMLKNLREFLTVGMVEPTVIEALKGISVSEGKSVYDEISAVNAEILKAQNPKTFPTQQGKLNDLVSTTRGNSSGVQTSSSDSINTPQVESLDTTGNDTKTGNTLRPVATIDGEQTGRGTSEATQSAETSTESQVEPSTEAKTIYEKLGSKTATGNVQIKYVLQAAGVAFANSLGGVFSLRVSGVKHHFGNPFSSVPKLLAADPSLIPTKNTQESVERYIDWVLNSKDERAKWIRSVLQSGDLKGKPIIYYAELGEPSHANALDYLINTHVWESQSATPEDEQTTTEPVASEDAKVTALQGVTDEIREEERNKPFSIRNMIRAYFTQDTTEDEQKGNNPLVLIKDFILQSDLLTNVSKYLSEKTKSRVTDAHIAQLKDFQEFHAKFSKVVMRVLHDDRSKVSKDNFVRELLNQENPEDLGTLDENVLTAISLAAYGYLIRFGNTVYNTDDDIRSIVRLKKDQELPSEVAQILRYAGHEAPIVEQQLGEQISKSLALKAMKDSSATLQNRLDVSFGNLVTAALHDVGYIELDDTSISPKVVGELLRHAGYVGNEDSGTQEESDGLVAQHALEKLGQLTFIRPNYYKDPKGQGLKLQTPDMIERKSKNTYSLLAPERDPATGDFYIKKLVWGTDLKQTSSTDIMNIIGLAKPTAGFLSKLMGVDVGFTVPTTTEPESIEGNTKQGTNNTVPKQQQELVKEGQVKAKFSIRANTVNALNALKSLSEDSKLLKQLLGVWYDDDVKARTHIRDRDSVEAKNKSEWDILERGLDWAGQISLGNDEYLDFYDTQYVSQNERMQYLSNFFNMQSSQLHRAMASLSAFKLEISLEDLTLSNENLTRFYQAVGEGLEGFDDVLKASIKKRAGLQQFFTVDKVSADNYTLALQEFLGTPESLKAIDAMESVLRGNKPSEAEQASIAQFVEHGDMGIQSLQSLIALAEMQMAIMDGKSFFTTTVGLGSDGVNNGVASANILTGVISREMKQQVGMLAKGQVKTMQEAFLRGLPDYYISFGIAMGKALKAVRERKSTTANNTKWHDALQELFPVYKAIEIASLEMRKVAKTWSIPFNYGAGKKSLQRALGRGFLDGIYGEMTNISNKALEAKAAFKEGKITKEVYTLTQENLKNKADTLQLHINTILQRARIMKNSKGQVISVNGKNQYLPRYAIKFPTDLTQLNEYTFGNAKEENNFVYSSMNKDTTQLVEQLLLDAVNAIHGAAAWEATQEYAEKYTKIRDTLNTSNTAAFMLYDGMRTKLIQAKLKQKEDALLGTIRAWNEQVNEHNEEIRSRLGALKAPKSPEWRKDTISTTELRAEHKYLGLTTEEMREIDDILAPINPTLHSALSQETGDLKSGIALATQETAIQKAEPSKQVETKYPNKYIRTEKGFASMRPVLRGLKDKLEVTSGIKSLAMAIQGIDAYVAAYLQAKFPTLNVHDAGIFGLKYFREATKYQNEIYLQAMTTYHLNVEHAEALVRSYLGLKDFIASLDSLNLSPEAKELFIKEAGYAMDDVLNGVAERNADGTVKTKKVMENMFNEETGEMEQREITIEIRTGIYKGLTEALGKLLGYEFDELTDIDSALKLWVSLAISKDLDKLESLKDIKSVHQYSGEGGEFTIGAKGDLEFSEHMRRIEEQRIALLVRKKELLEQIDRAGTELNLETGSSTRQSQLNKLFVANKGKDIDALAVVAILKSDKSASRSSEQHQRQLQILRAIEPFLKGVKVVYKDMENNEAEGITDRVRGFFEPKTNTIVIRANVIKSDDLALIVHEMLHAALSSRIEAIKSSNNKDSAEYKALAQLEDLRTQLLDNEVLPVNGNEFLALKAKVEKSGGVKAYDNAKEAIKNNKEYQQAVASKQSIKDSLEQANTQLAELNTKFTETQNKLESSKDNSLTLNRVSSERSALKDELRAEQAALQESLVTIAKEQITLRQQVKALHTSIKQANKEIEALIGKDKQIMQDVRTYHEMRNTLKDTVFVVQGGGKLSALKLVEMLEDVHEFISYGLTETTLQDIMQDVFEVPKGNRKPLSLRGAWKMFINAVGRILRMPNTKTLNALTAFSMDVADLLNAIGAVTPAEVSPDADKQFSLSAEDLVNGQSSLDIMQALPHSNTGAFNQQLDRLIVGEIGQLYNQDDAAKARIDEIQTFTASDALNAGFTLSRKEQYVQQALQYAVAAYMKLHAGGANVGQLRRVYHAAKVKMDVTGKDFHEGDWATATQQEKDLAKAKYDFMFDSTKEDYMSRFVSMALASESVNKLLDIALPLTKPDTQDKTWFETVSDWVSYVMAWLTNKYVRLNPVAGASNQLSQLMDNLVKLDIRNRQEGVAFHQKAWNTIGLVTTPLNKALKGAGGALLSGVGLRNSRFLPVRALGAILVLRSEEAAKAIPKMIIDMRNNQLPNTKLGEVANILLEASGVGTLRDKFDVLIRQTNLNAKNRQDIVDNVKKAVNAWFKEPLTKAQNKAIAYGLLGTDAQALLENYSVEDIVNMALHEGKLNAEIAKLKKEIAKNPNGNDMLNAAEQLGYYMVTRIGGEGLVKNALGIAIGLGTQYFTPVEQADPKLVSQLNTLVSMLAMTHVPNSDKAILAALYKTDAEGVHATIQLHQGLVNDSLKDFQANPLNMVKGWMPEVTNPYLEIKAANSMVERQQMEAEGWVLIDELKRDKHDKGSPKYLMKHNDIGYQRLVSGAVDLGSTARSGTEAISRTSPKYLGITQARYQNAARRAAIPNGSFDPSKQPRGLIAAYDTDGGALAYNYEMDNETRDAHLDRKHNIGDLLGTFAGLNYYKPEKAKQSNKVAEVLFEDYKANYSQNPNAYLKISPKSTDPKVVEMWRMLPQDFRQRATELYGKGNPIIIRNEAFNLAFGFKKFSVVSYAFDAVNAERARNKLGLVGEGKAPNKFQSGFVRFAEVTSNFKSGVIGAVGGTSKGTAQADFAKAEHVVQEIVKAIKDFIVIRSGTTMMWNIFANVLMLMANGINPVTIIKDWVFAVTNVRAYQKLNSQLIQAQADLAGGKDPVALKQKIGALKAELKANVMNPYINAGLLSSIVEDVNIQQGEYTYASAFKQTVDEKTRWIPKPVKTAAKVLTIAPSTKLYQFLATTTQLSDFVAKYSMSKHLQANGTDIDASIIEASKTFINYDVPTSQGLQYANDMGLFMFTKFFLRIQAVLMKLLGKRAGSTIAQHILVENLTGAEGILSPIAYGHIGNNPLESSVLGLPSAFFSIGTVDAVTDFGAPF